MWEIRRETYGTRAQVERLREGWEPFAATCSEGIDMVFLRKRVSAPPRDDQRDDQRDGDGKLPIPQFLRRKS